MDEVFLSNTTTTTEEEEHCRPPRIRFPSCNYLDLPQSLHRSSTASITNDSILTVITTPTSSYSNMVANLKERRKLIRRSYSAPSLFTDAREAFTDTTDTRTSPRSTSLILRQASIGVVLYVVIFVATYLISGGFKGTTTYKPLDALYFAVVTLCTIGYGDIVPDTTFAKLFSCVFILVGFGFISILLNGLVTYIFDRQEAILLSTIDENRFNTMVQTYMMDKAKGRMRIRTKVVLALVVVIGCISIGTITVHYVEKLEWVDSFYMSVTSVTTVGYGDFTFKTVTGRCFAVIWLLISTLAVAKALLYLTELMIDRRNRRIAKCVLQRKLTLGDLAAADLDNDGSISKSEFVIYKLMEMRKIAKKDIQQICNQFDCLDNTNCGKITLADLIGSD